MSDIIDDANENADRERQLCIEAARRPVRAMPTPCGICFNCEEPVGDGMCWCDADCRDDYEARHRAR